MRRSKSGDALHHRAAVHAGGPEVMRRTAPDAYWRAGVIIGNARDRERTRSHVTDLGAVLARTAPKRIVRIRAAVSIRAAHATISRSSGALGRTPEELAGPIRSRDLLTYKAPAGDGGARSPI
jgi:hypothetical protein